MAGTHDVLQPGSTIGPFRVLDRLGYGAVGEVFRVCDSLGRELALKLFSGDLNPTARERFLREGEVTAALSHPGIVTVHASGFHGERPYLVYELVAGEDLERVFDSLTREHLLQITEEVGLALGHAHDQGVVHRDLKPANVLLDAAGHAHVADFGIAQAVGLERLTLSGVLVGTPHYMSPEQATGAREHYGAHTDVWALGVLLYRVLTGRHPYRGKTFMELVTQVLRSSPPPPCELDGSISPLLNAVCMRALRHEPAERYPDGAAFAADLARARAGQPLQAAGSAGPNRVIAWVSLALAAAACVFALTRSGADPQHPSPAPPAATGAPSAEAALAAALGGDLAAVDAALDAVLPREREGVRGQLVRYAVEPTPDPARVTFVLGLLAARSREFPARPADPAEEALANAGFELAWDALQRLAREGATSESLRQACLARLEELAAAGLRVSSRRSFAFVDSLMNMRRLGPLDSPTYWALIRVCVQLDMPCPLGAFRLRQSTSGEAEERPWGQPPRGPWNRYVEARIRLEARGRPPLDLLASCADRLHGDYAALLGPRQWAQLATLASRALPMSEATPLLAEAIERAPLQPEPRIELGRRLCEQGDGEAALATLRLAREGMQSEGYQGLFGADSLETGLTAHTVHALALLERRPAARELYRQLRGRSTIFAAGLAERFPWLGD